MSLDLTEEKVSFTFNRLIQTDGIGGFYNGKGVKVKISITVFYQNFPPINAEMGDRWFNSDTGIEYVYVYDGDSFQWVQPY